MTKLIVTGLIACALSALIGYLLLPVLRALKAGQSIREVGPTWHNNKAGTPMMGGLMFIFALIICLLIAIPVMEDYSVFYVLALALCGGLLAAGSSASAADTIVTDDEGNDQQDHNQKNDQAKIFNQLRTNVFGCIFNDMPLNICNRMEGRGGDGGAVIIDGDGTHILVCCQRRLETFTAVKAVYGFQFALVTVGRQQCSDIC